jgi:hypothetical protein
MQYQTLLLFINFIIIFFLREREIYNIYIYNREERKNKKTKSCPKWKKVPTERRVWNTFSKTGNFLIF